MNGQKLIKEMAGRGHLAPAATGRLCWRWRLDIQPAERWRNR